MIRGVIKKKEAVWLSRGEHCRAERSAGSNAVERGGRA